MFERFLQNRDAAFKGIEPTTPCACNECQQMFYREERSLIKLPRKKSRRWPPSRVTITFADKSHIEVKCYDDKYFRTAHTVHPGEPGTLTLSSFLQVVGMRPRSSAPRRQTDRLRCSLQRSTLSAPWTSDWGRPLKLCIHTTLPWWIHKQSSGNPPQKASSFSSCQFVAQNYWL